MDFFFFLKDVCLLKINRVAVGTHDSGTSSEITADNKAEFNKVNKINWSTKAQVEVGNQIDEYYLRANLASNSKRCSYYLLSVRKVVHSLTEYGFLPFLCQN